MQAHLSTGEIQVVSHQQAAINKLNAVFLKLFNEGRLRDRWKTGPAYAVTFRIDEFSPEKITSTCTRHSALLAQIFRVLSISAEIFEEDVGTYFSLTSSDGFLALSRMSK